MHCGVREREREKCGCKPRHLILGEVFPSNALKRTKEKIQTHPHFRVFSKVPICALLSKTPDSFQD